ncbi:hypothetical protein HDK90DRAFT_484230 [Phyllosticta capitalensis]|uniref:Uncharacterized protein n=1 Tax=Phyllosticta capitalensis TaxID=121624 RepID=A0ABR1YP64_9PEZI
MGSLRHAATEVTGWLATRQAFFSLLLLLLLILLLFLYVPPPRSNPAGGLALNPRSFPSIFYALLATYLVVFFSAFSFWCTISSALAR